MAKDINSKASDGGDLDGENVNALDAVRGMCRSVANEQGGGIPDSEIVIPPNEPDDRESLTRDESEWGESPDDYQTGDGG